MTDHDDHLIERIRTSASGSTIAPPDSSKVIAAGRRRRRKDRLLASGVAVLVGLGVLLPLRALLPVGGDKAEVVDRSDPLPESCLGYRVDIYAIENDTTYEGSPGDDVIVQGGTSSFRPKGGMVISCMIDGSPGGVGVGDHPELMDTKNEAELIEEVRKVIDAEPYPVAGQLTEAEAVTMTPFDRDEAVALGWPETDEKLQERAISWYREQDVANAPVEDLKHALALLTNAISEPPQTGKPPAETLYVYEMVYRREAVCRSLPATTLRDEYCSLTSVPDLSEQDVPWREPPAA